jgi:tetratricopeptide (TPR) repeat protein
MYDEAGAIPPASFLFLSHSGGRLFLNRDIHRSMTRVSCAVAGYCLAFSFWFSASALVAQEAKPKPSAGGGAALTVENAVVLAQQGHCKEALPALKRGLASQRPSEIRKKAGIVGLRCAMSTDITDAALDFLRLLNHEFPEDPEVLFVLVHAYSDLSTGVAQTLARTAPQSLPARKLNAEALEMQGKWDEAQREYEEMIAKDPDAPSLHYLLGRLLLSRPQPDASSVQRAKDEFHKEIEIDPQNAGSEYILGEMARQESQFEEAIAHFSRAAQLDSSFGDAFMGWGFCLVTLKRYVEAIPPLQAAVRLQEGNPSAHYNLAVALSRTGQKEEAEKEFAIHRRLAQKPAPTEGHAQ